MWVLLGGLECRIYVLVSPQRETILCASHQSWGKAAGSARACLNATIYFTHDCFQSSNTSAIMLMLTLICVAFHFPILGVLAHAQKPVYSPFNSAPFQTYDTGLFAPLESLDLVSSDTFTVLSHPFFPKHSVRIKQLSGFCDTIARWVPVTHVSSFQHSDSTSTST